MVNKPGICGNPALYMQNLQGRSSEEARAVTLGMYIEKELPEDLQKQIEQHLRTCNPCADLLKELDSTDQVILDDPIPYAVCPASKVLDQYLFDRTSMPAELARKVSVHLHECPLCKEEMEWLTKAEKNKMMSFSFSSHKKVEYLAIAAAIFFFVLSVFLYQQKESLEFPGKQLQTLAVIQEPDQIDYASVLSESPALSSSLQQNFDQALQYFKAKDYRRASLLLERITKQDPTSSASFFLLGYCYYKLDKPQKAFALCDLAEQMHPKSYERCMLLVNIALKTGHYDRAITEITAMYHEAPEDPGIRDLYQRIMTVTRGRLEL